LNVTVETTPQSDAQFHVQIPWDEIDKTSDRVYKRVAQTQKIPGFRPGHAPRSLIERAVGKDAIYEEAIDIIVQDAVRSSANEHALTLLATPHAHVHEIKYGEEHDVTVTVPVLAKGELEDYADIRVTQEPVEVTEADIDNIIDRLRDQAAVWVPVDRAAQIGDRVTVELQLTVEEKEIVKPRETDFDLVEERTGLYTGIDAHIVGMAEGETKEFTVTIPEDYLNTELAGKTASYVVTLNKVAIKELPEVDDEFAKEASQGQYATVEALREGIRLDIQQTRENTAQRKARDAVIEALIGRLTLAVPPLLVEAEADDIMQDLANMLARERLDLQQYLRLMGKNPDEYREEMKPEAERRIKQRRALELMAEREGMTVSTAELQELLDAYSRAGGQRTRLNQLKPSQRLSIERSLLRDKALAKLLDQAIIIAPEAPSPEVTTESAPTGEQSSAEAKTSASEKTPADTEEAPAESSAAGATDTTPTETDATETGVSKPKGRKGR
jgi:trigger factor